MHHSGNFAIVVTCDIEFLLLYTFEFFSVKIFVFEENLYFLETYIHKSGFKSKSVSKYSKK